MQIIDRSVVEHDRHNATGRIARTEVLETTELAIRFLAHVSRSVPAPWLRSLLHTISLSSSASATTNQLSALLSVKGHRSY